MREPHALIIGQRRTQITKTLRLLGGVSTQSEININR